MRQGWSISRKLYLLVLASVMAGLLAATTVSIWLETHRYLASKQRELLAVAEVFASATASATAVRDPAAAREAMRAIGRIEGMQHARIRTPQGETLAAIGFAAQLDTDLRIDGAEEISLWRALRSQSVQVSAPIRDSGVTVGEFVLVGHASDLVHNLLQTLRLAVFCALLALAVGLLVAARLQRGITAPLRKLTWAMERIRASHDYDGRVEVSSNDEISRLVDGFNEMLSEIRKRDRQLEAQNLRLDAALENISQGLSMFDRDERLVLCNERYLEMYGLASAQATQGIGILQLLELRLACGSYPKGPPPTVYVAELAQTLQNETTALRVTELNDGRFIAVNSRSMPDGGWVATHDDVTESRQREELVRAQNLRFDAALNNMSHGLCMFDAQHRLVVCNEKFGQIYGLPPDLMRPGTSLRQIVQHRVDQGLYTTDGQDNETRELFAAASQNVALTRVTELTDGRAIVIKHRPMPDGGYVATHEDITEQRMIEARIKHIAHHDALTDLPNRVLVRERLHQAISQTSQKGGGLAVLCLDLDRFKEVNDTLGHPVGDALLRSVADRLRGCIRETDTAARLGGDEFAVVQTAPNQPMDATALAARIIEAISTAHDLNGQDIVVGTSIGIAMFPDDGIDADQLLRNADLALHRAKNEGRGNYRFFEKGMDERMQARRALERDLRLAIAKGEFELHYQPLIGLERNEVTGFEALLRWNHPERGRVSPADFIPLAEETGLIVPIGEWVLRQACAEATTWPTNIRVAVNLSPVQFISGGLVAVVFNALTASGLEPGRLELEITETVLLQNSEATLATLHKLRDLGISISMDDFGTGYSSLSYLRSFPFDKIKIDRSFIRDINENGQALAIVHAVTSLGASLGMRTTAEGVETREQLEQLRAEGCTEVQGYYFSPPRPAEEVRALLSKINCKSIAA